LILGIWKKNVQNPDAVYIIYGWLIINDVQPVVLRNLIWISHGPHRTQNNIAMANGSTSRIFGMWFQIPQTPPRNAFMEKSIIKTEIATLIIPKDLQYALCYRNRNIILFKNCSGWNALINFNFVVPGQLFWCLKLPLLLFIFLTRNSSNKYHNCHTVGVD